MPEVKGANAALRKIRMGTLALKIPMPVTPPTGFFWLHLVDNSSKALYLKICQNINLLQRPNSEGFLNDSRKSVNTALTGESKTMEKAFTILL